MGVADARSKTDLSNFFTRLFPPCTSVPALKPPAISLGRTQKGASTPPDNDGDDTTSAKTCVYPPASFIQFAAAIGRRDVRFEKVCHSFVGIDLIFDTRETVAFVFINFIFHNAATLLDGIDYLLGFGFWTARIATPGE